MEGGTWASDNPWKKQPYQKLVISLLLVQPIAVNLDSASEN